MQKQLDYMYAVARRMRVLIVILLSTRAWAVVSVKQSQFDYETIVARRVRVLIVILFIL